MMTVQELELRLKHKEQDDEIIIKVGNNYYELFMVHLHYFDDNKGNEGLCVILNCNEDEQNVKR